MCEWGDTVRLILSGKPVDVDRCITPLVQALNDGGVPTIASCCGHTHITGTIGLTDGRFIEIFPDREAWSVYADAHATDIHGAIRTPGSHRPSHLEPRHSSRREGS